MPDPIVGLVQLQARQPLPGLQQFNMIPSSEATSVAPYLFKADF